MFSSDCVSVRLYARSQQANHTVGALNANSLKMAKATDFKIDIRISRNNPDTIP